jgi:hypothetical protein
MAFRMNVSGNFQDDHWYTWHIYLIIIAFGCPIFQKSWKEAKIITKPIPGKDPKFPQNLHPISILSTMAKLFKKVILKLLQKHIEERGLLNASQFGFRARHSTTLQCMRLTDHVTLHFINNMSTAAVFLNIEKAFDTTWHLVFYISYLNWN